MWRHLFGILAAQATLLAFLESTYAAELGGWDRSDELECAPGKPRRPRPL